MSSQTRAVDSNFDSEEANRDIAIGLGTESIWDVKLVFWTFKETLLDKIQLW